MLCALDSNIMIYAEGLLDDLRSVSAQDLLQAIPSTNFVISAQAVAETANWLVRKAKCSKSFAAQRAAYWLERYQIQATNESVVSEACVLISEHDFQVFDAIILSSARAAGADMLISEDMQDGYVWRGVTVINPFSAQQHPLLSHMIKAR